MSLLCYIVKHVFYYSSSSGLAAHYWSVRHWQSVVTKVPRKCC
jgi:hypothetical protein